MDGWCNMQFPNQIVHKLIVQGSGNARIVIQVDENVFPGHQLPVISFTSESDTIPEIQIFWFDLFQALVFGPLDPGNDYAMYVGRNKWWLGRFDINTHSVSFELNGYLYAGNWDNLSTGPTVNDWTTLAYAGTWTTRAGFFPLAYKILPDGTVRLRGTLVPGAAALIATLPVGVRPASSCSYPCPCDSVAAGVTTRVNIAADGTITSLGIGGAPTTFGLDGISFPLV